MPTQDLSGTTALVTGASRGFGRAIAVALSSRGAHVAGVARDPGRGTARTTRRHLHPRRRRRRRPRGRGPTPRQIPPPHAGPQCRGSSPDAADPPANLADLQPQLGSRRAARVQLDPRGAAASPGAGQRGHRLLQRSRGQRLAAQRRLRRSQGHHPVHRVLRRRGVRAERARHQVHLGAAAAHSESDLGAAAVAGYAARQGVDIPAFLDRLGPALTPEQVGTAIVDIAAGAADDRDAYLLTATGLSPGGNALVPPRTVRSWTRDHEINHSRK